MTLNKVIGGSFVIKDTDFDSIMTPEDFTEEQQRIADSVRDFVKEDVFPHDEQLEKLDYELTLKLLRKAGEIGLLGADLPEVYGGLGLGKVSSTIIGETLAKASSFSLSVGAHVGIGTLPILLFGTPEQKKQYLPSLASGERIAAYCLTEPSSGSDALGAKTTATLSEDGKHYTLNGSKLYITNAGFADIFIVYAKVNGSEFSAFIVEKGLPGFSLGHEEKKMGIKASSTRPLFFEDVKVPVENLLGEIGKGHLIAFNILNIGRFKLASSCLGASKEAIELTSKYTNTRTQFGRAISSFPLIGRKLADMNIITYVMESMVYRTAGLLDDILQGIDPASPDYGSQVVNGVSEFALECSINKVFASEALDLVADEGVQAHGGYGFIQEYKIERIYRDSRINRIFEGTNEINRLLIPGTLMKKVKKGELVLPPKNEELDNEWLSLPSEELFEGTLKAEEQLVALAKKIFLMINGMAIQKYEGVLDQQQEILSNFADMMIEIFAMESTLLRVQKQVSRGGEEKATNAIQMTTVYIHEAFDRIRDYARESLLAMEEGEVLRSYLSIVQKSTTVAPVNRIQLKRKVAARVIREERYIV